MQRSRKVKNDEAKVRIMENTKAIFITLCSSPILSIEAAAFCSLAGEITLANPAPNARPAVTIIRPSVDRPRFLAVESEYFANIAIVEASLPVINPPNKPINDTIAPYD